MPKKLTEEEVRKTFADAGCELLSEYKNRRTKVKYHLYFPDIFIPHENMIIEVKSKYTYEIHKNKNEYKRKAVKALGYKFVLLIFESRKDPQLNQSFLSNFQHLDVNF